MPSAVTETSSYDSTVDAPVSGDARTAASVRNPFTNVANRTKYLKDQLTASLLVGGDIIDSSSGTSVNVCAIQCFMVDSSGGGVSKKYTSNALVATSSNLEVGSSFANNTIYYLYATIVSGSIALVISATGPDASRTWKTSTTTHRFLCTLITDGTGKILPFRKEHGKVTYRKSATSAVDFQVLSASGAASLTAQSCSAYVPPHARMVELDLYFHVGDAAGGSRVFNIRTNGDTGSIRAFTVTNDVGDVNATFPLELDSLLRFQYSVTASPSATTLSTTLQVSAYWE